MSFPKILKAAADALGPFNTFFNQINNSTMSFSNEKKVEKSLKSFENQKLDAETLKHLVGGTAGGSGDGGDEDEDGTNVVSDDIILP